MIPTFEDAWASAKQFGRSPDHVKEGWDLCLDHLIRAGMYPGTPKDGEIHPDGSEHLPAARRTLLDIAREKQSIDQKADARALHRVLESEAGWKYAAFEKDTRIAKLDDAVRKLRAELVEFDSGYKRCRVCRNQWSSGDEESHRTECVVNSFFHDDGLDEVPAASQLHGAGAAVAAKVVSTPRAALRCAACDCSLGELTRHQVMDSGDRWWCSTCWNRLLEGARYDDFKLGIVGKEEREKAPVQPGHDPVNHPSHYTSSPSGVECIDVIEHMTLNVGNATKYLWRAGQKGDLIEDLSKARWYVDREIKRVTKLRAKETNRGTP